MELFERDGNPTAEAGGVDEVPVNLDGASGDVAVSVGLFAIAFGVFSG